MICRCSSPIPPITVSLVSPSKRVVNDGSSSDSLDSDWASFSVCLEPAALTLTEMTERGTAIDSKTSGWFGSQSVSPVTVSFMPTSATMSPARTSLISSRSRAWMRNTRPTRSDLPVRGL